MLSDIQRVLFKAALSSDPPLLTSDPQVNHAVDNHMDDCNLPYDSVLYDQEIRAWIKSGGMLLSYN